MKEKKRLTGFFFGTRCSFCRWMEAIGKSPEERAKIMENIEEVEATAEEIAQKEAEKLRQIRAEADMAYSQASNETETFQVALNTITTMFDAFAYKFPCFRNASEEMISGFFEAEKVLMPSRNRQMVFFKHWRDYQN